MTRLILKDIKLQNKIFLVYILVSIISYSGLFYEIKSGELGLNNSFIIEGTMLLLLIIFPMSSINHIISKEASKGNKIELLFRSLPINTKDIVLGKAITPIVLFMIYAITTIIFQIIVANIFQIKLNESTIFTILLISFIIVYIYSTIVFYSNILFPNKKGTYYLRIIPMFVLAICINLYKKFLGNLFNITVLNRNLNIILCVICIISIIISMISSKFILDKYKRIDV